MHASLLEPRRPGAMSRRRHLYSGTRFRKALRYFLAGRAAQAVASVAVLLLAIRLLPQTDYGAYMVLLGIVEICRPLSSLGLLPTVQQFLPEMALHASRAQLHAFVRWAALARFGALVAFAAALYAFWLPVTTWLGFESDHLGQAWVACLLVVTLLGASFTDHMLEALLEQRYAQFIRALYPVGRLIGLVALGITGEATLLNMLWVDISVSALCLMLAEGTLLRQVRRLEPDASRHFTLGEIARFCWHLSGAQVLNAAASGGALRVVVAATLGITAAGQFGFMQQLVSQVQRFLPSIMLANLVRPMLIAAHLSGDHARVAAAAGLLRKSNLLLVLPLAAFVFVGGQWLADAISGNRLPDAAPALALLVLSTVSAAQTQVTAIFLQVLRHSDLVRRLSGLALVAPMVVYAGGQLGLAWAAAGVVAASWLRSAASLAALARREPYLGLDSNGAIRAAAAVLLAVAVGRPMATYDGALAIAVSALCYLVLLVLFRPLSASDVEVMLAVAPAQHRASLTRWVERVTRRDGAP